MGDDIVATFPTVQRRRFVRPVRPAAAAAAGPTVRRVRFAANTSNAAAQASPGRWIATSRTTRGSETLPQGLSGRRVRFTAATGDTAALAPPGRFMATTNTSSTAAQASLRTGSSGSALVENRQRLAEQARASAQRVWRDVLTRRQEQLTRQLEEIQAQNEDRMERRQRPRRNFSAVSSSSSPLHELLRQQRRSSQRPLQMQRSTSGRQTAFTRLRATPTTTSTVQCPTLEEVSHDKPSPEGSPACVICQERIPICIALPCLHMSYCVACARSLCLQAETGRPKRQVQCAKCRQSVDAVSRVFMEE